MASLIDSLRYKLGWTYRPPGDERFYAEMNGVKKPVNPRYDSECRGLDADGDRLINQDEEAYITQDVPFRIDRARFTDEHLHAFTETPLPELKTYPSYAECTAKLQDLEKRFPGQAHLQSLGKSHEGRDIWDLQIGAADKPGVVVTGLTHAREWPSLSIPLALAEDMLENHDPRLERCSVHVVPIVNPDGYEYNSRNVDPLWRKNRNPEAPVDLNRNYCDPAHPELYRQPGDTPDTEHDDVGASDNPAYSTYRGHSGASEPEVVALQKLTSNPQVIASLENHCCGELVLYPDHGDHAVYEAIGAHMKEALGPDYKVENTSALYPVTGTPNDLQDAHGQLGMTIESCLSFQPPAADLARTLPKAVEAHKIFIDEALARR